MGKEIKVEWCEDFIRKLFTRHHPLAKGIEANLFWQLAEESGLYEKGTYGSPMSEALSKLTTVEIISLKGQYCYSVFRLI